MTYGSGASDDLLAPFWAAAQQGRLVLQVCEACGDLRFPPTVVCPKCLGTAQQWREASGMGTLESVAEFHRAYWDRYTGRIPYKVCLVRLAEGPLLISNIGVGSPDPGPGDPVRVTFEQDDDGRMIPRFVRV